MTIMYGINEAEITYCNVYRKVGQVAGVDEPVEKYRRVLNAVPFFIEPLASTSPFGGTTWNATHRLHSKFREDLRSEDRIVELNKHGMETNVKYTILLIQSFRPHHLEIYAVLDSLPLVT